MYDLINELIIPLDERDVRLFNEAFEVMNKENYYKDSIMEIDEKKYISYKEFYPLIEDLVSEIEQLQEDNNNLYQQLHNERWENEE